MNEIRRHTRQELIDKHGLADIEDRCRRVSAANKRKGEPPIGAIVLDTDTVRAWAPSVLHQPPDAPEPRVNLPTGVLWTWTESEGLVAE